MMPIHYSYAPVLQPAQAAAVRKARLAKEKSEFQSALAQLLEEKDGGAASQTPPGERFSIETTDPAAENGSASYDLQLDGKPVAPPDNVTQLMDSILQDLGEIPEEYLVAAGDGGYRQNQRSEQDPADVWKGTYHEEGALLLQRMGLQAPPLPQKLVRAARTRRPSGQRRFRRLHARQVRTSGRAAEAALSSCCAAKTGCSRSSPTATTSISTR